MVRSTGVALGSLASILEVAILGWAFLAESFGDVMVYYSFTTVSPLIGGAFAIGVLVVFLAIRLGRLSETTGTGLAFALAMFNFVIVSIWAFTLPVDVFLAPGWAFPAQRWVLVGVSALIVIGVGMHVRTQGLFPSWNE